MTQDQLKFWELQEQQRHNQQTEKLGELELTPKQQQAQAALSQADTRKGELKEKQSARSMAHDEWNNEFTWSMFAPFVTGQYIKNIGSGVGSLLK